MNGSGLAGGLGAALVVSLSLWFADHAWQNSERLTVQNEGMARELVAMATALDSQAVLRDAVDKIDRQTRFISTALDGQAAQLNRNLAELKRTDEKTNSYLAELVPVALGLRYQRPETTDPVAYRAGAVVQPRAVSPAGSAAASQ
jgi:hypothetical protein